MRPRSEPQGLRRRLTASRAALAAAPLLFALSACTSGDPASNELDPTTTLYTLVSTVDGTYFYPPFGPSPVPNTGAFEGSVLSQLSIVLESTAADGDFRTVAIFDSRSSPPLYVLPAYEIYMVNVPAAAYFTDASLAYRWRILLNGAELGRSDVSPSIFQYIANVPNLTMGVKTRVERRPIATITSLSPSQVARNSAGFTLTVSGTRISNDSSIRFNGVPYATRRAENGALLADLPATVLTTPGNYNVQVYTPPPGGGLSAAATFTVFDPPPVVTAVNPTETTANGPSLNLTLTGSFFTDASQVRIDGQNVGSTFLSDTSILVPLSAGQIQLAGVRSITVTNPPALTSAPVQFTVSNPVPVLGSILPSSAVALANDFPLTVYGSSFTRQSNIVFAGQSQSTSYISSTELRATVSTNLIAEPGERTVTITSPAPGGGTSNAVVFDVASPVPSITSIAPTTGSLGATSLTLTVNGASFTGGSVIWVSGTPLATTYVSRTRLTAVLPASLLASAGTLEIVVHAAAPSNETSGTLYFTVLNPSPTVTSVTPSSAMINQPRLVLSVVGSGFVDGAAIRFNNTAIPTTFVSDTALTGEVPTNLYAVGGTKTITVQNPEPSNPSTTSDTITVFNPLPVITSITPQAVPVGSPTFVMTIEGTGFLNLPYTILDSRELGYRTWLSNTRVIVTVPSDRLRTPGDFPFIMRNPLPTIGYTQPVTFTVLAPTCNDGIQNGNETAIDCGGPDCPVCFNQGCVEGDATCTQLSVGLQSNAGVASASDTASGLRVSAVNDALAGSTVSAWGNAGARDSRLMIRLARAYDVFGLGITWGGNNGGWRSGTNYYLPTQMQVQVSSDPTAVAGDPVTSSKWTQITDVGHLLTSSPGNVTGAEIQPGFVNASWGSAQSIAFNRTPATAIRVIFDGNPASIGGTNSVGLVSELDVLGAVIADGSACTSGASCASGVCTNGLCDAPTCTDGVKNGVETDSDCGGTCGQCALDQHCLVAADCTTGLACVGYVCSTPSCTDGQQNGAETGVDCGGPSCSPCADGLGCNVATDCQSASCVAGTCAAPSCFDGIKNGTESDTDCGSHCALRCDDGLRCSTNIDCQSDRCVSGVCQIPLAVVSALSPSSALSGSAGLTLTLTGSQFRSSAQVTFAGTPLVTTFVSTNELRSTVPTSLLQTAGSYDVVVTNAGSGVSSSRTFSVQNPQPVITSFNPATVSAGTASFTLTVTGSSFVSGALVVFNNAALSTSFQSSTELRATVPSSAVTLGGYYGFHVENPAPNAGNAVGRTLTVNNVVPTLTSITPASRPVAGTGFTMTIDGSGFSTGAQAAFGGTNVATTFVSTTRVTAVIPANLLTVAGTMGVTVANSAPGGGTSASIAFSVASPTCTDAVKNGNESDTDCGGTSCAGCATARSCNVGTDCASFVCTSNLCQAPVCGDGVKNGTESDVDCGGSCGRCVAGRTCTTGADCASSVCTGSLCQAPSCNDGVMNGTETGVDCGNTDCGPCPINACGSGNGACTSCLAILEAGLSQGNGIYTIDPDGSGPIASFSTYCDMTTDGGGWSLAAKLSGAAMSASATDPRTAMFAGNIGVGSSLLMNRGAQTSHYSTPLTTTAWSLFSEARYEVITNGAVQQYLVFDSTNQTPQNTFARSRLKYTSFNDLWDETFNFFSVDGDTAARRHFFIQRNYGGCPSDNGWIAVTRGGTSCTWDTSAPYAIRYARGTTYQSNQGTNYAVADVLALWVRERAPHTARQTCLQILEGGASTGSGVYNIDPDGSGTTIPVYCDMDTAGGGWTMIYKHSAGTPIPAAAADVIGVNYLGGNLNETDTTLLDRRRGTRDYANRMLLRHWGRFNEARVEVTSGNAPVQYMRYSTTGQTRQGFYAKAQLLESSWADLSAETQNYWSPRGDETNRRHWFVNRNYNGCSTDAGWVTVVNGTGCSWESTRANSILYATGNTYTNWTTGTVGQADALVLMVRERVPTTYGLAPRTCQAWMNAGFTTSGQYNIDPTQSGVNIPVYCDMSTDGGGWTLAWKHNSGINRDIGSDIAGANLNASNTALMTRNRDAIDFASPILASYRFPQFSQARFEVVTGGTVRHYFVHNAAGQTARGVMARSTLLRTSWTDITSNTQNFFAIDGDTSCSRRAFINRNYSGCASDAGWLVALQGTGCNCSWETANSNQIVYAVPTTVQNWTSGQTARADALMMWLR